MSLYPGTQIGGGSLVDPSDRPTRILGRVSDLGSSLGRNSAGEIVNGAGGTVFADTGALPAGTYRISTIVGDQPGLTEINFAVEHRDSANGSTLFTYPIIGIAGARQNPCVFKVVLGANERVRAIARVANTSNVWVAILWERLDA